MISFRTKQRLQRPSMYATNPTMNNFSSPLFLFTFIVLLLSILGRGDTKPKKSGHDSGEGAVRSPNEIVPYWLIEIRQESVFSTLFDRFTKNVLKWCWSGEADKEHALSQCDRSAMKDEVENMIRDPKKSDIYAGMIESMSTCMRNSHLCPDPCISNPCRHSESNSLSRKCHKVFSSGTNKLLTNQTWDISATMVDYKCECEHPLQRWDGLLHRCVNVSTCDEVEPCVTPNTFNCTDTKRDHGFNCHCLPQYEGLQCETPINICTKNTSICGDHGTCVMIDGVYGNVNHTHRCKCDQGWTAQDLNTEPNCDAKILEDTLEDSSRLASIILISVPLLAIVLCCGAFCIGQIISKSNGEASPNIKELMLAQKKLQARGKKSELQALLEPQVANKGFSSVSLGSDTPVMKARFSPSSQKSGPNLRKRDSRDSSPSVLESLLWPEEEEFCNFLKEKSIMQGSKNTKSSKRRKHHAHFLKNRFQRLVGSKTNEDTEQRGIARDEDMSSPDEVVDQLFLRPTNKKTNNSAIKKAEHGYPTQESNIEDKFVEPSPDRAPIAGDVVRNVISSWNDARLRYEKEQKKKFNKTQEKVRRFFGNTDN